MKCGRPEDSRSRKEGVRKEVIWANRLRQTRGGRPTRRRGGGSRNQTRTKRKNSLGRMPMRSARIWLEDRGGEKATRPAKTNEKSTPAMEEVSRGGWISGKGGPVRTKGRGVAATFWLNGGVTSSRPETGSSEATSARNGQRHRGLILGPKGKRVPFCEEGKGIGKRSCGRKRFKGGDLGGGREVERLSRRDRGARRGGGKLFPSEIVSLKGRARIKPRRGNKKQKESTVSSNSQ